MRTESPIGVILVLAVFFGINPAQGANVISIDSVEVDLSEDVSIPLTIELSPGTTMGAVTVEVEYDANVVVLADCIENPLANTGLDLVLCNEPSTGVVRATGISVAGTAGPILLVDLGFQAIASGTSVLQLTVETLADEAGTTIAPVTTVNGSVTVTSDDADTDADGIADSQDNCQLLVNADQRDSNGDGFGNVCDADFNNDCIVNLIDLGIFRLAFFSADPDSDLNGDGVVNFLDLGQLRLLFFSVPGPSGVATSCSG